MSVGALAPTTESALAIGPVVMVLSIMVSLLPDKPTHTLPTIITAIIITAD